jgi:hypothetical protein
MALWGIALLAAGAFAWNAGSLYLRSAAVLSAVASGERPVWIPSWMIYPVAERTESISLPSGTTRARFYVPRGRRKPPGIVMVHGVHRLGIGEPRLVSFARALASAGVVVLTPEMKELAAYRVGPGTISAIADCTGYLADRTHRSGSGVIGISFAGGLALIAAADPNTRGTIGFVAAIGAHHDLTRVARFYTTKKTAGPDDRRHFSRPHPYGARVLLNSYLDEIFANRDLPAAREAFRLYLHDQHRRAREHAKLLSTAGSEKLLRLLDHEDDLARVALSSMIDAHADDFMRVSPRGRIAGLRVPVYLLHGSGDPIIPSTETRWLEREVPGDALRLSLVTPLLRHAELNEKTDAFDHWMLTRFVAKLLATAYRLPAVPGTGPWRCQP